MAAKLEALAASAFWLHASEEHDITEVRAHFFLRQPLHHCKCKAKCRKTKLALNSM